jgi:hypothetical protein
VKLAIVSEAIKGVMSQYCETEKLGKSKVCKGHPCTGTEALYRPYGL